MRDVAIRCSSPPPCYRWSAWPTGWPTSMTGWRTSPFYVLLLLAAVACGDALRSRRAAQHSRELQHAAERDAAAKDMFIQLRNELSRELHDSLGHSLVAISTRASVAAHVARPARGPRAPSRPARRGVGQHRCPRRTTGDVADAGTAPHRSRDGLRGARPTRCARPASTCPSAVGGECPRSRPPPVARGLPHPAGEPDQRAATLHATCAEVSLKRSADGLTIEVLNDGSKAPVASGHGIRNMQVRASELGGTVEAGVRQGDTVAGQGLDSGGGVSVEAPAHRDIRVVVAEDHAMIRAGFARADRRRTDDARRRASGRRSTGCRR